MTHNRIQFFMVHARDSRHAIQMHLFFMSSIRYQHRVSLAHTNFFTNFVDLKLYSSPSIYLDQPVPHAASCTISENGHEAYFAVAHQTNVVLYTMNCVNGQVAHIELKENYTMPRILSNITEAFRYFLLIL